MWGGIKIMKGEYLVTLPNELICKILKKLTFNDLSNTIAVCRKLRNLGSNPFMWTLFCLQMDQKHVAVLQHLREILSLPKFESIQQVNLLGQQLKLHDIQIKDIWHLLR